MRMIRLAFEGSCNLISDMKSLALRRLSAFTVIVAASCAPARTPTPAPVVVPPLVRAPLPAPTSAKLPPIPDVRGPIQIDVVYPKPDQMLTTRDSNFIFGSVGSGDAAVIINGRAVPVWPNGAFMAWLPVPTDSAPRYEIFAGNRADTAHLTLPVKIPAAPDTTHRQNAVGDTLNPIARTDTLVPVVGSLYAALGNRSSTVNDTDRVTIGMPEPRESGQEYKWFLFPGSVVKVTGYRRIGSQDFVRVELDSGDVAWVLRGELARDSTAKVPGMFVGDSSAPVRQIGAVRLQPSADGIDVVIPMTGPPPPYLVEEGDRSLSLLVYGVTNPPVVSMMPQPTDPYFNSISSTPEGSRVRYTINLNRAPYGYLALWQNGALTFRVRRPPRIADPANPLRGLTITVDPGHPPGGETGPTRLYEADATLQVGFRLRDLLAQRGVNVVMTRTTPDPVDLGLRPIISRRANAHAFVSIHLNAEPDGVNPFVTNGSMTLYFWPQSIPLASFTQAQLLSELGLNDKGARFQNIAVARGTWMPSILTEGAYGIMPDQEAAMRTPEYQDAYATAILRGLESYFASLAQTQ
jgi:N-acetylmuramoyl-L-alanine amidase